MKRIFITSIILAVLFIARTAFGQELISSWNSMTPDQAAANAKITPAYLGVSNPGLLPTNPFYFFKEWKRSAALALSADNLKRADLELDFSNERAAEIAKLAALVPGDSASISEALDNYSGNINDFENAIAAVSEDVSNPDLTNLLNKEIDFSIKHEGLLSDLKTQFKAQDDLVSKVNGIESQLASVTLQSAARFDSVEGFKSRLVSIIVEQSNSQDSLSALFINSRVASVLALWEEKATGDFKQAIAELRNDLMSYIKNEVEVQSDDVKIDLMSPDFWNNLSSGESQIFVELMATSTTEATSTSLLKIK